MLSLKPWRSRHVFTLVALAILCSGCGKERSTAPEPQSSTEQSVRYARVVRQQLPEDLDLAAKVQADPTKLVRIFPPASGRITAIDVKPGDRVSRGETVVLISSSDVAGARSDYSKAKTEAERSAHAADRQKLLYEHGAAAEKDYEDARAQSDAAQAELARSLQRLELLHLSPSSASDQVAMVSPLNGVVLDVSAAPGEFSKSLESANPIITIANLDQVWVIADVYERDVAKLHPGIQAVVTIQAYPGREWHGAIGPVSGAFDPVTRTLKVRVAIANGDGRLRPEMFGTVRVNVGTRSALVVQATAIIHEGNNATVFVKNAGKAEQRTVKTGQTMGNLVEVLEGLQEGDEVAADGAELLKGGSEE